MKLPVATVREVRYGAKWDERFWAYVTIGQKTYDARGMNAYDAWQKLQTLTGGQLDPARYYAPHAYD